jgi:hypothetical protein
MSDDDLSRVRAEYQAIGTMDHKAVTPELELRYRYLQARIQVLQGTAREEALWRALSDERRLELMALCCRGCGSLDTGCQCWNDE